jgi:hypothetical protein
MGFSFDTIVQVGLAMLGQNRMKTSAIDIRQTFQPVLGMRPWSVKVGVGSFLTLEFGPRIKAHGHIHGKWHLWIYQSNWKLFHLDRELVDSANDRKLISVSIRRLKETALTNVDCDPSSGKTVFSFEKFRLVVSAADYLDRPDERDHYWMFFMPDNEVLEVGPAGVRVERSEESLRV